MFLGIYYNLSIWFKLTDRTHYGTIITVLGMVITIALNYTLIPIYGYMGSSWATFACYLSMASVCYWLGQKYYPIPYKLVHSMGYLLLAIFLIAISSYVSISYQIGATAFHAILLVAFVLIVYFLEKKAWIEIRQN